MWERQLISLAVSKSIILASLVLRQRRRIGNYTLLIECPDKHTALKIESHIKAMKSRKYIENLARYPEMVKKLIHWFSDGSAGYPDSYPDRYWGS